MEGQRMKKRLLIAFMMVGALLLVASSGDSEDNNANNANNDKTADKAADNEVVAWAWDPEFNIAALEIAKEHYDGDEDITLDIIENAQDDIIQKLNTGLSSGAGKGDRKSTRLNSSHVAISYA